MTVEARIPIDEYALRRTAAARLVAEAASTCW
jgi:hypothetical protein